MGNTVRKYLKKYFIDAMGAMAQGLFASLLVFWCRRSLFFVYLKV